MAGETATDSRFLIASRWQFFQAHVKCCSAYSAGHQPRKFQRTTILISYLFVFFLQEVDDSNIIFKSNSMRFGENFRRG